MSDVRLIAYRCRCGAEPEHTTWDAFHYDCDDFISGPASVADLVAAPRNEGGIEGVLAAGEAFDVSADLTITTAREPGAALVRSDLGKRVLVVPLEDE